LALDRVKTLKGWTKNCSRLIRVSRIRRFLFLELGMLDLKRETDGRHGSVTKIAAPFGKNLGSIQLWQRGLNLIVKLREKSGGCGG
jgi:hypothetical protein